METRKKARHIVLGLGLSLLLGVSLLLTVCTGIDIVRANESDAYHGEFVGHSETLSEYDLYSATNTYNATAYAVGSDYIDDYQYDETGKKVFNDWYDLSTSNKKTVSTDAPSVTVFTHGLDADAKHWSNDNSGAFAYDEQSPVQQLNALVKQSTGEDADIYWALMRNVSETEQPDVKFFLVPLNDQKAQTNYNDYDEHYSVKTLPSSSHHIILLFEAYNPNASNNYIYKQFNYALSKIIYDIAYYNGGVLPRLNLIGHSRGGLTNLQYALDHPDMVAGLFSFDTPYLGSHSAKTSLADSFMGGPGLVSINDQDVYYHYNDRWNDNYDTLYSDIEVYAMGGYSDMNFLLDNVKATLTNEGHKTGIEIAKAYLTLGSTFYTTTAINVLVNLLTEITPLTSFKLPYLLLAAASCGLNPYYITEHPEAILGEIQLFVSTIPGLSERLGNVMAYADVLKDIDYEWWNVLVPGAPMFYNDVCVDLDSQLGKDENRTYKGFTTFTKEFTMNNVTRLNGNGAIRQGVYGRPPVVHNMALYDSELIKYMLRHLAVGGSTPTYLTQDVTGGKEIMLYMGNISGNTLEIPETIDGQPVVAIGDFAFAQDFYGKSYSAVVIPDSVEKIGSYAFENCAQLSAVTFGADSALTWIGDGAFTGCAMLESIAIGEQVDSIGQNVFEGCTALASISVASANVSYAAQDGVLFNKDYSQLIQYPIAKQSTAYTVPAETDYIFANAFAGNTYLQSINLNQVKVLSDYVFLNCTNLNTVTGGSQLETLLTGVFGNTAWYASLTGEYAFLGPVLMKYNGTAETLDLRNAPQEFDIIASCAFYENENLQEVILPEEIETISVTAFYGCDNLSDVYLLSLDSVADIGHAAFGNNESLQIYVSKQTEDLYKANETMQMYGYDDRLASIQVPVSFNSNGGDTYASIYLDYGGLVTDLPEYISKEFHIFDGWYVDGTRYQNGMLWDRTEPTTLEAQWIVKNYAIEYQIPSASSNDVRNPLYFNINDDVTLYNPSAIEHYDFGGWYDNAAYAGTAITNVNQLTGHTTLYAKFVPHQFTVRFDLNYDTDEQLSDVVVDYDSNDYVFENPARTGYAFIGWYYLDDNVKQFVWYADGGAFTSWYLAQDVTLSADWEKEHYYLEFKSDGEYLLNAAGECFDNVMLEYGQSLSKAALLSDLNNGADGTYYCTDMNILFDGFIWESVPDLGENGCVVTADVSVVYETFTLQFLDADYQVFATKEYKLADSIQPLPNFGFVTAGQYIDGWFVDDRLGDHINHPLFDVGDKIYFEQQEIGSTVFTMPDLTAGYFENATIILSPDIQYYEYTIYLHDENDSVIEVISGIKYGDAYSLTIPEKVGHDFEGCYYLDNENEISFPVSGNYSLTDSVHVFIRYSPKIFTITYELGNSVFLDSGTMRDTYTYGESFSLPAFYKVGYLYNGLYIKNTTEKRTYIYATDCRDFVFVPQFTGTVYTLSSASPNSVNITAAYSIVESYSSAGNPIRCMINIAATVNVFTIKSNYSAFQNTSLTVLTRNTPLKIILDGYMTYGYDNSHGISSNNNADLTISVCSTSFVGGAKSTDQNNTTGKYGIYKPSGKLILETFRHNYTTHQQLSVMGGAGYSYLYQKMSSPRSGGDGGYGIRANELEITFLQLKAYGGAGACGSDGTTGAAGTSVNWNGGTGVNGGSGGDGGYGIYVNKLTLVSVIGEIFGGDGGSGGEGGAGGNGYTQTGVGGGSYQPDGLPGGNGGVGGRGGNGGNGNYGINDVSQLSRDGDSFLQIYGGNGGYGMNGGRGGNGGDGGDGGKGEWNKRGGDGGDGGDGGQGGQSGNGGNGQNATPFDALYSDFCTTEAGSGKVSVVSNPGGSGGLGGAGGAKGGWFNSAGDPGRDGDPGASGAAGTDGTP